MIVARLNTCGRLPVVVPATYQKTWHGATKAIAAGADWIARKAAKRLVKLI